MNSTDLQLVNYAAAVALELRQPAAGGEPVIRFNFKNGSDATFMTYDFLNRTGDVPLSAFIDAMAVSGIAGLAHLVSASR